jgi:putative SOS response-associated peptidase YedK
MQRTRQERPIYNLSMCGRYRMSRRKQIIEEHFDTADWQDDWSPRYNIAPTQPVPVIRQHPKERVRQISLMKWGLIPNWAKDPSIVTGTINAKSETAAEKPAFRDPLKSRRCLIPADGFYEWRRAGVSKQPFCFEASKLTTASCLRLPDCGSAGAIRVDCG